MSQQTLFADAGKASLDSLSALAAPAMQGAQQLAALNMQATKATLAELAETLQAAQSAKSPAELGKLQAAALQAAPQKALAYTRQVKEILAAASATQQSAVATQVADVQAKFLEAVQGMLKNVPGTENTVSLMKSAIAAANNAYDGLDKVSKQVGTALDANVASVTATVSRAANAPVDA